MSLRDENIIDDDGRIDLLDPYVCGVVGHSGGITLDGCFSAEDLEFLLSKMKKVEIEIPAERLEILGE